MAAAVVAAVLVELAAAVGGAVDLDRAVVIVVRDAAVAAAGVPSGATANAMLPERAVAVPPAAMRQGGAVGLFVGWAVG